MKRHTLLPADAVEVSKEAEFKKSVESIASKYPHALLTHGVWRVPSHHNRLAVIIGCSHPGCDTERLVHTSDLFQVKLCETHKEEARKAAAAAKRKEKAPAPSTSRTAPTPPPALPASPVVTKTAEKAVRKEKAGITLVRRPRSSKK